MQNPLSPARSNRVPRITRTRPGLCRRLYRSLRLAWLKRRERQLKDEAQDLVHKMALDQAALVAYGSKPHPNAAAIELRIQQDHDYYQRLVLPSLAVVQRELRRAEAQS